MHAASGDDDAVARDANALLLVLNAVGIPVLVRALGEAHAPPSATVGVLGALFHAAASSSSSSSHSSRTTTALQALATFRRTIAYHAAPQDLLLVLAGDVPLASVDAARVLGSVSAALALLLGAQRLEALDAARQRLALARHAETLDRIVRCCRRDVRLLLGRPARVLRGSHLTPRSSECAKVQQRIWLRGGVVVTEHVAGSWSLKLDATEIVVLALLGENLAARGLRRTWQAMAVGCSSDCGGSIARVAVVVSRSGDSSCIGVFSEDAADCEMQQEMDWMEESVVDSPEVPPSMPDELLDKLPRTFVCGYASRLDGGAASPSCRTIGFLSPNWEGAWAGAQPSEPPPTAMDSSIKTDTSAASSVKEEVVWRTLCEFVACRLDVVPRVSSRTSSHSSAPQFLDYKREDEFFTLLHHSRGLLHFFSLCVGSLSLEQTTSVGDVLHEYFSSYRE